MESKNNPYPEEKAPGRCEGADYYLDPDDLALYYKILGVMKKSGVTYGNAINVVEYVKKHLQREAMRQRLE